MCEARYPALVLERLKPEDPERAFVNLAELYDTDVLVKGRRLVPLYHAPVEDLSEQPASAEAEEGDKSW
jgi:hypothetical protein